MFVIFALLSQISIAQITMRESNVVERAVFKPQQFDSLTNIIMQNRPTDYKKYIGYKLFFLPKSTNYKPRHSSNEDNVVVIDFLFSKVGIQIVEENRAIFDDTGIGQLMLKQGKPKGAGLEQYNRLKEEYDKGGVKTTNTYKPQSLSSIPITKRIGGAKVHSAEFGTIPDSVEGKYFVILDIKGKISGNEYLKLEDIDIGGRNPDLLSLEIALRNETNKDTLFWVIEQARFMGKPFILVPYFEKQKSMYLNQNLVLKYINRTNTNLENLIDVNTGEIVKIKFGEVWTCSDVSFIDSKDSYYLSGFYFLKNGNREVKFDLESNLLNDYFMLETEYIKQELEKQKKEEERIKEEQEREKIRQQEQIKFRNDCIAKWGQKMGTYIADGKVMLSMNKEMCIAAWGKPINTNRTIVRGLTHEQWVYGWANYLYFENGILTGIQD